MATTLRPHVKLVCPVCGVNLSTVCRDTSDNTTSWVLSARSQDHLEAHDA